MFDSSTNTNKDKLAKPYDNKKTIISTYETS